MLQVAVATTTFPGSHSSTSSSTERITASNTVCISSNSVSSPTINGLRHRSEFLRFDLARSRKYLTEVWLWTVRAYRRGSLSINGPPSGHESSQKYANSPFLILHLKQSALIKLFLAWHLPWSFQAYPYFHLPKELHYLSVWPFLKILLIL